MKKIWIICALVVCLLVGLGICCSLLMVTPPIEGQIENPDWWVPVSVGVVWVLVVVDLVLLFAIVVFNLLRKL